MIVYRAAFTSRHFTFEAHGATKDDAIAALIDGLRLHARQYGIEPDWWMHGFEGAPTDEIFEIDQFELGIAYRDGQVLVPH